MEVSMRKKFNVWGSSSPTEQSLTDNEVYVQAENNAMNGDSERGTVNGLMLNANSKKIGKAEIEKALSILEEYKSAKAVLEARIVEEEKYYMHTYNKDAKKKLGTFKADEETPTSGWLFNAIQNKHADFMDNYPEPICIAREQSDEEEAKKLTSILPVILEQNNFYRTYSKEAWYKIKHGVGVYSVLWNPELDNGLGNIDIGRPDILNLYWAPGITDIQQSPHFFSVNLEDNDVLESMYPELAGKLGTESISYVKYSHDETDTSKKTMVIDWYYKNKVNGKDVLHYCKFVGDTVLYASENDTNYAVNGYYEHGKYPFVFDVLFPEESTPVGFGMIAVGKDPQTYIDIIDKAALEHALKSATPRWIAGENTGINEDEWKDWSKSVVHAQGTNDVSQEKFKDITIPPLPAAVLNLKEAKINELKECLNNRDFSNGSTSAGVTSGAAIATLQEAGNKSSRDMIKDSQNSFVEVNYFSIELIRQFYTEERTFRIRNANGTGYEYTSYTNAGLRIQPMTQMINGVEQPIILGENAMGEAEYAVRLPIIDIKVKAQKQSPFTTLAQNETAMNLYNAGFFNPELAQQALICLEMMDFEGKEKIVEYVSNGQTLQNQLDQMNMQIMQASQMLASQGLNPAMFGLIPMQMGNPMPSGGGVSSSNPIATAQDGALERATTPYIENLKERARV